MTNADRWQEDHRLDDERCVDGLLAEADLPDDAELRALLLELRNLRVAEVPEPSPEVAALMGEPVTADVIGLAGWPRKHPKKKRVVFTSLALAASLGVAGGAAAGNDTLRSKAEGTISSIVGSLFPSSPAKPAPASPAPEPAQAPTPAPAVVLPSPAGTATATVPRAERSAGDGRAGTQETPRKPQVQDGKATGRDGAAGPTNGKPAQPGASRAAEVPSPARDRSGNQWPARDRPVNDRPMNERPSGDGDGPGNGDANGAARNDPGSGQDLGDTKAPPAKGDGR